MKLKVLGVIAGIALACSGVVGHAPGEPAETPDGVQPLLIGAQVPKLTLRAADGTDFDLNDAIGKKPTILIFYRGGW